MPAPVTEKPRGNPRENTGENSGEIPGGMPRPRTLTKPGRNGGMLLSGGTNKGGSGRPTDAWKALAREIVNQDAVLEAAQRIIEDADHPAWLGCFKWLTILAYGRPGREGIEVEAKKPKTQYALNIGGQEITYGG